MTLIRVMELANQLGREIVAAPDPATRRKHLLAATRFLDLLVELADGAPVDGMMDGLLDDIETTLDDGDHSRKVPPLRVVS